MDIKNCSSPCINTGSVSKQKTMLGTCSLKPYTPLNLTYIIGTSCGQNETLIARVFIETNKNRADLRSMKEGSFSFFIMCHNVLNATP